MLSLLVEVLVFMLIIGLIFYIAKALGAPQLWINIGGAIVGVFCLIWLIYTLYGFTGGVGHPLLR